MAVDGDGGGGESETAGALGGRETAGAFGGCEGAVDGDGGGGERQGKGERGEEGEIVELDLGTILRRGAGGV